MKNLLIKRTNLVGSVAYDKLLYGIVFSLIVSIILVYFLIRYSGINHQNGFAFALYKNI